uniref:Uncharacterized protein n=1 Tax=Aegilops tauschii subsp. strangulata TaxID=200361 RepID=A0A453B3R8_AEGTS
GQFFFIIPGNHGGEHKCRTLTVLSKSRHIIIYKTSYYKDTRIKMTVCELIVLLMS